MKTKQTITVPIDELACFITRLVAVSVEHDGKRLNYKNLKEIYRIVTEDLKTADFKTVKKEFDELLFIYKNYSFWRVNDENNNSEPAKGK